MTKVEELEEIVRQHTGQVTFTRNGCDICVGIADSRDLWAIGSTLEEAITNFIWMFKNRRAARAVRELVK